MKAYDVQFLCPVTVPKASWGPHLLGSLVSSLWEPCPVLRSYVVCSQCRVTLNLRSKVRAKMRFIWIWLGNWRKGVRLASKSYVFPLLGSWIAVSSHSLLVTWLSRRSLMPRKAGGSLWTYDFPSGNVSYVCVFWAFMWAFQSPLPLFLQLITVQWREHDGPLQPCHLLRALTDVSARGPRPGVLSSTREWTD